MNRKIEEAFGKTKAELQKNKNTNSRFLQAILQVRSVSTIYLEGVIEKYSERYSLYSQANKIERSLLPRKHYQKEQLKKLHAKKDNHQGKEKEALLLYKNIALVMIKYKGIGDRTSKENVQKLLLHYNKPLNAKSTLMSLLEEVTPLVVDDFTKILQHIGEKKTLKEPPPLPIIRNELITTNNYKI